MKLTEAQRCLLLSGEEEALALSLAMQKKEYSKAQFKLHPDLFTDAECQSNFRFKKADLNMLCEALAIPTFNRCRNGTRFSGIEGLLIMLYRMRYPNRYVDWARKYGREPAEASFIFNWMLDFMHERHGHLLETLDHWWLNQNHVMHYAEKMVAQGSVLPRCWAYIDGTVRPMCRPSQLQRECYNGHKKVHALKFQAIQTPNGLIAHLFGPVPGRRHDAFMLTESGVLPILIHQEAVRGGHGYYIYGDSGYPIREVLISPFRGNLTQPQQDFNSAMSKLRVSVEWGFGKMLQLFAFVDFKKNLKLFKQAVGKTYAVAALLTNIHTCLYGSQTSEKFDCNPPTIFQYLHNDENA